MSVFFALLTAAFVMFGKPRENVGVIAYAIVACMLVFSTISLHLGRWPW